MAAEDSWEQLKLEQLSIKDTSTSSAPESQQQQLLQQQQGQQQQQQQVPVSQEHNAFAAELHLAAPEEQPVLYALAGQHERMQALRIEDDVLAFIGDTNRDVLEFPQSYGNYQRLLAHKVAQYHGLQTSTADYEGSTGRVVAHRKCVETKSRPRLSQLVVSPNTIATAAAQQQQQFSRGSMGGTGALPDPRPRLLQRPSGAEGQRNGPEMDRQPVARSAKDREEEYNKARQRIIGEAAASSPPSSTPSPIGATNSAFGGIGNGGSGNGVGGGRGNAGGRFMGGRGAAGGVGGGMVAGGFQGSGFRGRGRKGGRGDRNAELQQDPDYMRGPSRYGPAGGAYDPVAAAAAVNGYMVPPGAMYTMPYAAEVGRDMSGASMYPTSMPSPAATAAGAMSPHAGAANRALPPPPPLSMQPSLGSSGKFSSANSTPTSLFPPPPPPHGAAALPTPTPYPTPAAHPATPYPAMTSMAMAYPPAMMPPGTPPMYGAMHPAAAYPYPPQMGVTPTPPTPYPGTPYPGADPMAAAAAMQGSYPMMAHPHMHGGYPMMAHPHMHPGMAPAMAMGRGMHTPPYPGAMAMPQAPYPTMQPDSMYHAAATNPAAAAAMYHHQSGGQQPYGPSMYGQQAPHPYGGGMYGGGGGNQNYYGGGRGRGRGGGHAQRDHHDSYQGGQGRGRGGGNMGFSHGNHSTSNSNHHMRSLSVDTGSSGSPSVQQLHSGPAGSGVMQPQFADTPGAGGAAHLSKSSKMAHVAATAEPMGAGEAAQLQQQQQQLQQDGPADAGEGR